MSIADFKVFNTLKGGMGEAEAQELIGFVKSEVNTVIMEQTKTFLTKEDKIELVSAIKETEVKLLAAMNDDKIYLMNSIKDCQLSIKEVQVYMMNMMKNDRTDLLRTIYLVGLAQFLAILTAVLAIFNFLKQAGS